MKLSSDANELLEPGKLTRIGLDDVRDIPTIKMPYGQEVPIVHASAGIRRIAALSYALVWTWQEHLRACEITGESPAKSIVVLIDELEEHLHPRWQRVILPALLETVQALTKQYKLDVQIIATTHSPMVMASLEPLFDPEKDAWFDLNLVDGKVTLEKMASYRQGDANAWLQSAAFDLSGTGSIQVDEAKDRAAKALEGSRLTKKKFLELDRELRSLLTDTDEFWIRWRFVGQKKGWL
ncbi:MAG: ATP-binding protein [Pleurocapsa sp. SU_196_0]|nr:ATP-binding protein [Pleurocapsa sp. SU_196_0]